MHEIAVVQNEFSLLYRTEAEETLRTTRALKIGFVAYSPLGRGLLTGVVDDPTGMSDGDTRRRHPRFATENINHNLSLVRGIEEIAQERRCTLGQLALAWLLAQGKDIVPIPGTKKKERLAENIGALAVELTADDLAQIAELNSGWCRRRLALSGEPYEEPLSLRMSTIRRSPSPAGGGSRTAGARGGVAAMP